MQALWEAGVEIDHIDGSSADLSNLQLLCSDCHRTKAEHLVPTSPEQRALLLALMVSRVIPDEPTLLGDDEVNWETSWRTLKKARRQRLVDGLESAES